MEQTTFDFLKQPGQQLPEGFRYQPEFLSEDEERELLRGIAGVEWREVRMHGVVAKRRVIHYGLDYGYESWQLVEGPPIPRFTEPFLARAAVELGITRAEIAAVLITHYPPGAGIGWHRDAPMFGDAVFGVSLAAPCTMKLRREVSGAFETVKVQLEPRSSYVISGPSRSVWQHSIPAVKADRYSITVRTRRFP